MIKGKFIPFEIVRIIFIANIVSLIMALNYCYQHYFNNQGKGFGDYLCAITIFSLNLFFVTMAVRRFEDNSKARFWLSLGLGYLLLSTIFIDKEILFGQGI